MFDREPTPGQTLAVLLGASIYRYAPKLARGPAFYNSSQQFGQYLVDKMAMPEENIASFFDESRSAGDQLRDIRDFLERRASDLKSAGTPAHDLIVHYVGHGLFSGSDNDYCLAIRATDEQNEGFTSIRMRDLATVIRNSATFMRKYLILDCCFAGAAYAQFQSGPLSVVRVKVRDLLDDDSPQRGTSLLCSASARDPSVAPMGLPRTMFSDSLLTVLSEGHEAFGPWMSFSELGELVRSRIKETYKDSGVRPEVHSPDQSSGDVARIALFPNPARARTNVEDSEARRLAQERAEAERQAKARAEAERIAREKAETRRLAQEAAEADRQAKARAEVEETARQKADAKRLAQERAEAEHQAKARAEAERVAREKTEAKRLAHERAEAERQAIARVEAEKTARQKAEAKKLALVSAKAEAQKKVEAERHVQQLAAEEAEQETQAEQLRTEVAQKRFIVRRFWLTSISALIVAFCLDAFYLLLDSFVPGILNFIVKGVVWLIASFCLVGYGADLDKSPRRGWLAIAICFFFCLGHLGFQLVLGSSMSSWGWCIATIPWLLLIAVKPNKKQT